MNLILDISTGPLPNAADFLEPAHAPVNYKDPVKIKAYVEEKNAERLAGAGLDPDLCRITAIGRLWSHLEDGPLVTFCRTEADEREAILNLSLILKTNIATITYNGKSFDLPILIRRARYLGVKFPSLNLSKYDSIHVDLMEELTDRKIERRRSLGFYARRLGWADLVKPLSGEEESRVHETGKWEELGKSILHDLEATKRLAAWLGVI